MIVKFYTKWCRYCKEMSPEYEKLYEELKDNKELVIARLDAEANEDIKAKYRISSFPMILWFNKDDV